MLDEKKYDRFHEEVEQLRQVAVAGDWQGAEQGQPVRLDNVVTPAATARAEPQVRGAADGPINDEAVEAMGMVNWNGPDVDGDAMFVISSITMVISSNTMRPAGGGTQSSRYSCTGVCFSAQGCGSALR